MINAISSHSGSLSSYYQIGDSTRKIEVPVPSSLSVYAQFKYVRGVPASSNQEPVSLSRAQIIDNMVSYLNSSPEKMSPEISSDNSNSSEFTLNKLEKEVYKVVNDVTPNFTSLPGKSGDTGIIFNVSA